MCKTNFYRKKSSVSIFAKQDIFGEKIDLKLTGNIRNAQNLYFTKLNENTHLKEKMRKVLNAIKDKALTK